MRVKTYSKIIIIIAKRIASDKPACIKLLRFLDATLDLGVCCVGGDAFELPNPRVIVRYL